ncbi:hypothetical protein EB325_20585 [Salmonella enterica]|nr:hypothetical protein [Salmonella enterica subsp. arizonae serovar 13,23:gz51:-]EBN1849507.1 hypothetical protein [Salmonella enterica subsp. arizonae serovar 13,23:gz51:-]MDJ26421.1 hypothetical protein [Salmonella enterica subsp. arizonae serovar 13,23:gz51:-]SUG21262.1 Uncharacterised protein [Salmonella enterica subsp. arizonae]
MSVLIYLLNSYSEPLQIRLYDAPQSKSLIPLWYCEINIQHSLNIYILDVKKVGTVGELTILLIVKVIYAIK